MICPYCEFENVDGIDCCDNCDQDLTYLDKHQPKSEVEKSIMNASLELLAPKPPVFVTEEATVAEAVLKICERNIGCVLVGTPDDLKGIFSERDVLLRVADRYEQVCTSPITEFMTVRPARLPLSAPIAFALNRMSMGLSCWRIRARRCC